MVLDVFVLDAVRWSEILTETILVTCSMTTLIVPTCAVLLSDQANSSRCHADKTVNSNYFNT